MNIVGIHLALIVIQRSRFITFPLKSLTKYICCSLRYAGFVRWNTEITVIAIAVFLRPINIRWRGEREACSAGIIETFALLTDVFFLLHEHTEIMQIIINYHVMNSPIGPKKKKKKNGDSMIWWRWTDAACISGCVCGLNTSQCKVPLWFSLCPTFLLSYQGRTCETAPSKHLLTHVRVCINIHRLTCMPMLKAKKHNEGKKKIKK